MRTNKKLGILGGMGPAASSNWYRMILSIIEKKYLVSQDYEYPEIYLFSLSMNGWSERGIEDMDEVKRNIIKAITKMEYLEVDYIVIACNTAHSIYNYLQRSTTIPILNLITHCVSYVSELEYDKVGLISTETTNRIKLYENEFNRNGIRCITMGIPYEQNIINQVILSVQRGTCGKDEREIMCEIIESMKCNGAKAIVLGCTELPLSISEKDVDIPLIDPGYILLNKVTDLLYENVFSINS